MVVRRLAPALVIASRSDGLGNLLDVMLVDAVLDTPLVEPLEQAVDCALRAVDLMKQLAATLREVREVHREVAEPRLVDAGRLHQASILHMFALVGAVLLRVLKPRPGFHLVSLRIARQHLQQASAAAARRQWRWLVWPAAGAGHLLAAGPFHAHQHASGTDARLFQEHAVVHHAEVVFDLHQPLQQRRQRAEVRQARRVLVNRLPHEVVEYRDDGGA
mmetsp:Transcript_99887/g.258102  ORF Transcript_99887/g.258102 Transcript_99887/m.258102 type:complete len:218 (+) Transcript_99887:1186-1839(+)